MSTNLTAKINEAEHVHCASAFVYTHNIHAYFRVVGGLNNGLMVTAPGGSSVTVRDRPPNVLGVE